MGNRLLLLIVLGLAVLGFMILASGMPSLELQEGGIIFETAVPLPLEEADMTELTRPEPVQGSPNAIYALIGIFAFLILTFLAYRYREIRYGILGISIFTAFLLFMVYLYRRLAPPADEQVNLDQLLTRAERLFEELPKDPPQWMDSASTGVALMFLLIVAILLWWVWRRWSLKRKPPLETIGREAEAALTDLRAGADLQDTIKRCYFDMNQALVKSRGVRRPDGMTPREFEQVMGDAGFPMNDVQGLTRLFEKVRYGAVSAGEADQQEAIACLEGIVAAAGKGSPPAHPQAA